MRNNKLYHYICRPQYRLFIGNPGTGKSTLANCVANQFLFKSGVSLGHGLTFQLDLKEHKGITYLDTPGLADIKLREQAAKAITEALRKNGRYQIFFVITLEAGRIRPEDMATIKLVMDSTSDIKHYSIIINKLSTPVYNFLTQNNQKELTVLVTEITEQIKCTKNPPTILLLLNIMELFDAPNKFVKLDDLDKFAKEAPCITVKPASVMEINGDSASFKKIMEMLIQQILELRNDQQRMEKLHKETEEKYRKLMQTESAKEEVIFLILFYLYF